MCSAAIIRPLIIALVVGCLFGAGPARAGFSVDENPCEIPWDPGDLFFPGGMCDMDDGDMSCPPPMFNLPNPINFDMDAFAVDQPLQVCPPQPPFPPGILFSFDDGEPGAGAGPPNHATEIFFYDHCRTLTPNRRSYYTTMTEPALGLGAPPPPAAADDDVDAFDTRNAALYYQNQYTLLFSPDTPADGGLGPGSEANIYFVNLLSPMPLVWATPMQLGVPDPANCNIDGIAPIYEPATPYALLFTTDDRANCGLDPGDIWVSDLAGSYWLYADDVNDLHIASSESDLVDIDALAINDGGDFGILDPYEPPDLTTYKADWGNYAPSGMPDFEQGHQGWPKTYCGPTAVANSLWWFDSEMDCAKNRTFGDQAESESNDFCNIADSLGENPPIPGSLAGSVDVDWYQFRAPKGDWQSCTVKISTCALRQLGDADTELWLYGGCDAAGQPTGLIAHNDDGCAPAAQSEIFVSLDPGLYYVKVATGPTGAGGAYTLSLGLDCYPLVKAHAAAPDDHSNYNPEPLIRRLALCMNTDNQGGTGQPHKGTDIVEMQACINSWLIDSGLDQHYVERTVNAPPFDEVAAEIKKSEDVVLLLGYYWREPLGGPWIRCGGHYVTSAGVNAPQRTITVADPAIDNAEPPPHGKGAPGRVRGPNHSNHAPGAPPPPDHDDAQNVSHDRYAVAPSNIGLPWAQWALSAYATAGAPTTCGDVYNVCMTMDYGQNPSPVPPPIPDQPCPNAGYPVTVEVEAMVDVSPKQAPSCILLDPLTLWPDNLRVLHTACPSPQPTGLTYDVIRGKLCELRPAGLTLDLGPVQCLYDDAAFDQFDELSPDDPGCYGSYFFLIRQSGDADYGSGAAGPRLPGSGGCP